MTVNPSSHDRDAALYADRRRNRWADRLFAACFQGGRVRGVCQRVFGLALGYDDLIGHGYLRHNPGMAVLAGKSTLNRRGFARRCGKLAVERSADGDAPAGW